MTCIKLHYALLLTDINECQTGGHNCAAAGADCTDVTPATDGGTKFTCACWDGFSGFGTSCTRETNCACLGPRARSVYKNIII